MSNPDDLLSELASFVDAAVHIQAPMVSAAALDQKLDVLERVVELLRLRTGRMENALRMEDLLATRLSVSKVSNDAPVLNVGERRPVADALSWRSPDGRTEDELQVPLVLYLLKSYRANRRINDLLVDFLRAIRTSLSPADVESTRTGVTRVMTTTRSAARTLRLYGLLTDSDRTAYKTWELSVLGLLVGARLHERVGSSPEVPTRGIRKSGEGKYGGSGHLAEPLSDILQEFSHPAKVAAAIRRVCGPDREVFETFDRAVEIVAAFCQQHVNAIGARAPEPQELRMAAGALLKELGELIPSTVLADDLAKSFAMTEVLSG